MKVRPATAAAGADAGARPQSTSDTAVALGELPPPRAARTGVKSQDHLTDMPALWAALGAPPLAFGVFVAARKAARDLRARAAARKASPRTELKNRLTKARDAARGNDARALDAAVAHALEAAAVAHAGVNIRGAMGDEVKTRLSGAGVGAGTADAVQTILRACEEARFSPDLADLAHARERLSRAEEAIAKLEGRQ